MASADLGLELAKLSVIRSDWSVKHWNRVELPAESFSSADVLPSFAILIPLSLSAS